MVSSGSLEGLVAHASTNRTDYKLRVNCDIRIAHKADEIQYVKEFHVHLDEILSMRTLYVQVL